MKYLTKFLITIFFVLFSMSAGFSQKTRHFEVKYSIGLMKTIVQDEWDNFMIYSNKKFQPFRIDLRYNDKKWIQLVSFYYMTDKLKALNGEELYNYNYVEIRHGELNYDLLYQVYKSENQKFSVFAGMGVHGFGSFRHRESLNKQYPYTDFVDSYDVNSGSLQITACPNYTNGKHYFGLTLSTGFLSYLTRPDYYNSRFNSNDGKWLIVSFNKHFNMLSLIEYKYDISKRFSLSLEYRFFYYSYSLPYKLKVLNKNYLAGLIYNF